MGAETAIGEELGYCSAKRSRWRREGVEELVEAIILNICPGAEKESFSFVYVFTILKGGGRKLYGKQALVGLTKRENTEPTNGFCNRQ